MALNSKFYISARLAEWLQRTESRAVAAARDSDFSRTYGITSVDPEEPIDQGVGAANG